MDISSIFDRQVIFDKFVKTKSKLRLDERYKKAITDESGKYYIDIALNNRDNRITINYIKYIFTIFFLVSLSIFITELIYAKTNPDHWLVKNLYAIIYILFLVFIVIVVLVIFNIQSDKNIIDSLISLVITLNDEGILTLNDEGILKDKKHREKTINYLYDNRDSIGGFYVKIKNYIIKSNVLKYYNFLPPFFIGIITTYFSGVLKTEQNISSDEMFKILLLIFILFITLSLIYIIVYVSLYILIKNEIWDDELYKISLENLMYIYKLREADGIISYLYKLGVGEKEDKKSEIQQNGIKKEMSSLDECNVEIFKNFFWGKLTDKGYHIIIKALTLVDLVYSFLFFNCAKMSNKMLFVLYFSSLIAILYLKYNSNTNKSEEIFKINEDKASNDIESFYQSLKKNYNRAYIFKLSSLAILFVLIIPKWLIFNSFPKNGSLRHELLILSNSSLLLILAGVILYEFINAVRIEFLRTLVSNNKKD